MACAITSGMACVALGVAQTTSDCDILCQPEGLPGLLEVLEETSFRGVPPSYRGSLSAPLDAPWLRGGWTSHIVWPSKEDSAYLFVFGVPPHASPGWELEVRGSYAGVNTVAEMKRTDRPKDWPYATALGVQMLKAKDERGWLSIFDDEMLTLLPEEFPLSEKVVSQRPVLALAQRQDARLRPAILAEVQFWQELDRLRLQIFQKAARPYAAAVRASVEPRSLRSQHALRRDLASAHLPQRPMEDYGIAAYLREARARLEQFVRPELLEWLPQVEKYFTMESI